MEEHWDACKNVDLIKIRKMIQGVMCQFQDDRKQSLSILESKLHIHRCRQKPGTCMSEHQKGFKHFIAACEHNGGSFGCEKGLVESIPHGQGTLHEIANGDQMQDAVSKSRDKPVATMFICNADGAICGSFMADLQNQSAINPDVCPNDLEAAHSRMMNWVPPVAVPNPTNNNQSANQQDNRQGTTNMAFTQTPTDNENNSSAMVGDPTRK